MIIALESVHETQELVSGRQVYQGIYLREWITVFWARLIEIHEINAHSPLSVRLLDLNHIC